MDPVSTYVRKQPQIFWNSPCLPFKLYIIFSLGMHDASSFVHLANVGGDTSFQCIAIHLLAGILIINNNILINLSWFLLTFIIDVSPRRITIGSSGMVSPVISLSTLNIDTQYEFPELYMTTYWTHLTEIPSPSCHFIQCQSGHKQDGGDGQYPAQHVCPGWIHVPAIKCQRLVPN